MCYFKFLISILNKIPHNRNFSQEEQVLAGEDIIRFFPYLHAASPSFSVLERIYLSPEGQRKVNLRREMLTVAGTPMPPWLQWQ
jgi:hypothetical protein